MKHAVVMVVEKPKGLQLTAKNQVSSMYDEEIRVEVACTVPCTMVVLVLAKIEVHYVEVECMKDYTHCAGTKYTKPEGCENTRTRRRLLFLLFYENQAVKLGGDEFETPDDENFAMTAYPDYEVALGPTSLC